MRRIHRLLTLLLGLIVSLSWAAMPAAAAPSGTHLAFLPYISTQEPAEPTFEERVIALTNIERVNAGLAPFNTSAALVRAAEKYAAVMASYDTLGHDVDGTRFYDRITAEGYIWWTCGENAAAGYATPEDVVAGWMGSPSHRENILNPDFTDIGVGYAYRADGDWHHFWVMDLAAPG